MSDGHAAMVLAVLASPDDPGPRLILADWIDEHGGDASYLRQPGDWFLPLYPGRSRVAGVDDWMGPDRQRLCWSDGRTGMDLGIVPLAIPCGASTLQDASVPHDDDLLAFRRYAGTARWLCESCYKHCVLEVPRQSRLRCVRWREESFTGILAYAAGLEPRPTLLDHDVVYPDGAINGNTSLVLLDATGQYILTASPLLDSGPPRFWIGTEEYR